MDRYKEPRTARELIEDYCRWAGAVAAYGVNKELLQEVNIILTLMVAKLATFEVAEADYKKKRNEIFYELYKDGHIIGKNLKITPGAHIDILMDAKVDADMRKESIERYWVSKGLRVCISRLNLMANVVVMDEDIKIPDNVPNKKLDSFDSGMKDSDKGIPINELL